jgi:hypothetical protein
MKRLSWAAVALLLVALAMVLPRLPVRSDDDDGEDEESERLEDIRIGLAELTPYIGEWVGERGAGDQKQVSTRSLRWILGQTFMEGETESRVGNAAVFRAKLIYTWDTGAKRLVCYFFEEPAIVQRFELGERKDGTQIWEEVGRANGMRVEMSAVKDDAYRVAAYRRDKAGKLETFSDTTYRRKKAK